MGSNDDTVYNGIIQFGPKTGLTPVARSVVVCLFGVFLPTREFFHSYGDVTITGEELHILTYARHVWPLSSDGSLTCHTYSDPGHPFIMVISEDQ